MAVAVARAAVAAAVARMEAPAAQARTPRTAAGAATGRGAVGAPRKTRTRRSSTWSTPTASPQPVQVTTGITDGSFTEIVAGNVTAGTQVIVGAAIKGAPAAAATTLPPGMGGGFRGPGGGGGGGGRGGGR